MELNEKKKPNNIEKTLSKLKQARACADDGDRLPPIPPSKAFKTSKKDKRDKPKHKKDNDHDFE
jgi:hypothetical protein